MRITPLFQHNGFGGQEFHNHPCTRLVKLIPKQQQRWQWWQSQESNRVGLHCCLGGNKKWEEKLLPLSYYKDHQQKYKTHGTNTYTIAVAVLPGKYLSKQAHDQLRPCKSAPTTFFS